MSRGGHDGEKTDRGFKGVGGTRPSEDGIGPSRRGFGVGERSRLAPVLNRALRDAATKPTIPYDDPLSFRPNPTTAPPPANKAVCGDALNDRELEQMVAEIDSDRDGKVGLLRRRENESALSKKERRWRRRRAPAAPGSPLSTAPRNHRGVVSCARIVLVMLGRKVSFDGALEERWSPRVSRKKDRLRLSRLYPPTQL